MGRAPCCDKAQVKKGPWSPEEDTKLKEFIEKYGTGGNWIALPHKAGLKRCGKSCRLRWLNYLRPNIKHGDFSDDEDRIICSLFASFGSRWSIIAAQLPGRTDNDIKNYWNTKLKKKLLKGMMLPSYTPPSFPPFLQSSPSPSTSTYKSSNGIYYPPSKSLTDLEQPTSNPSYLFNNRNSSTTITSLLFSQENLVGPIHQYQGKDSLLMFGSGHEPSSSSSDGSCNQISYVKDNNEYDQYGGDQQTDVENYFYSGVEEKHKFMIGDRWTTERSNGFLGENSSSSSSEYSLEEIKQLVSSNGCNSFFMDETKAHGRDVYYY